MGITYFDVIKMEFGRKEFTISDLAKLTGNYDVRKLLSDMKMKGLIKRVGRGVYVVNRPIKKIDKRTEEWRRVRDIVLRAPFEKAWTGSTGISVWTEGRYVTLPNLYLEVYHLRVNYADLEKWKEYLKKHAISFKGSKRIGTWVSLEPAPEIRYVTVNGEPVIPKDEALKLIKDHPGIYAGAEELLAA
jgi:hypothetical protein